jgi:hypothetical protein
MAGKRRTIPPRPKLLALSELDQRTTLARQAARLQWQLTTDLGGDLSAAQSVLVARATLLATFCEACEAKWLSTGELDDSYVGATSALRHVLGQLGIERRPRPVKTLQQHLAERARQ